jgi:hypothetical protein
MEKTLWQLPLELDGEVKTCSGCGEQKSVNDFRLFYDKRDGKMYRYTHCRACVAAYNRDYRAGKRHPRPKKVDGDRRCCAACHEWKPLTEFTVGSSHCRPCRNFRTRLKGLGPARRKKQREYMREYRKTHNYNDRIQSTLLEIYGSVCACCGESERKFLTIDHVNNDGAEKRRTYGKSKYRRWLSQQPKQPDIRTLCWNCNCGRRLNNGVCPHEENKPVMEN